MPKTLLTNENNQITDFVDAMGLGSNPDNLHFNSEALYEFSLRYFDEFEKLRDANKVFEGKVCPDDAIRGELESFNLHYGKQ